MSEPSIPEQVRRRGLIPVNIPSSHGPLSIMTSRFTLGWLVHLKGKNKSDYINRFLGYTNLEGGMNPIIAAALASSIVIMIGAAVMIGTSIGPGTVRKQLE